MQNSFEPVSLVVPLGTVRDAIDQLVEDRAVAAATAYVSSGYRAEALAFAADVATLADIRAEFDAAPVHLKNRIQWLVEVAAEIVATRRAALSESAAAFFAGIDRARGATC